MRISFPDLLPEAQGREVFDEEERFSRIVPKSAAALLHGGAEPDRSFTTAPLPREFALVDNLEPVFPLLQPKRRRRDA